MSEDAWRLVVFAFAWVLGIVIGMILLGCTHPHGPQVIPPIKYERTEWVISGLADVGTTTISFREVWPGEDWRDWERQEPKKVQAKRQRDYEKFLKERQGR